LFKGYNLAKRTTKGDGKMSLTYEIWIHSNHKWPKLLEVAKRLQQEEWFINLKFHEKNLAIVAISEQEIIGFLRLVTQKIGSDMDCDILCFNGEELTEAKILAFGVIDEWKTKGIGTELQKKAIETARQLGCYQIRSHSSGTYKENHHIKLKLGFAFQPIVRGNDIAGGYFIKSLDANT
jgi:GNAT superfamily N-acetyltransferase